jgi:hypothetical protein
VLGALGGDGFWRWKYLGKGKMRMRAQRKSRRGEKVKKNKRNEVM